MIPFAVAFIAIGAWTKVETECRDGLIRFALDRHLNTAPTED